MIINFFGETSHYIECSSNHYSCVVGIINIIIIFTIIIYLNEMRCNLEETFGGIGLAARCTLLYYCKREVKKFADVKTCEENDE